MHTRNILKFCLVTVKKCSVETWIFIPERKMYRLTYFMLFYAYLNNKWITEKVNKFEMRTNTL
jgi:hypothetical protein